MVYKPRLVALWILFYPGPAVNAACAAGHVACHSRDQPRHSSCLSGCELPYSASWTWIDYAILHSLGMHGLQTAKPTVTRGPGPGAPGILLTTSLLPAALHATSRTGACAQSQSCPGRAAVMPVAAGPQRPGLPAKELDDLTCYMTI